MIAFGFLWLPSGLVVYDICAEVHQGHRVYVAALSSDPLVRFFGRTRAHAEEQLIAHVRTQRPMPAPTRS